MKSMTHRCSEVLYSVFGIEHRAESDYAMEKMNGPQTQNITFLRPEFVLFSIYSKKISSYHNTYL